MVRARRVSRRRRRTSAYPDARWRPACDARARRRSVAIGSAAIHLPGIQDRPNRHRVQYWARGPDMIAVGKIMRNNGEELASEAFTNWSDSGGPVETVLDRGV
jgi:hypothetical protein